MNYLASTLAAILVLIVSSSTALQAQAILLDWDQSWDFLSPTRGALPRSSEGIAPHPVGTTAWSAPKADFDATYVGPSFAASSPGFEAGSGNSPLGYGTMTYLGTPLPAPGEFDSIGTLLIAPPSGSRYTSYFRTTFTVPDDGNDYSNPVIRYIMDDGGFIYLDGELILAVNMPGANSTYLATASNTANTETHLREARLNLTPGSLTGGNEESALAGNTTVEKQVSGLLPGEHTIAVALHNYKNDSSDLFLALQVQAGEPRCTLTATISDLAQSDGGTPNNPVDDTVDFTVNVTASGEFGTAWKVMAPGSATHEAGGAYDTDIVISGIPIGEFASGSLNLLIEDADDPLCNAVITVTPPQVIGSNLLTGINIPVTTSSDSDATGWVVNGIERTMSMNSPGGGPWQLTSEVIDLSSSREVLFSGVLQIDDSSSGTEDGDTFLATLIIDGDLDNPVNLITPHDTILPDGILSGAELAPAPGNFILELNHLIPRSANSVQLVIEAINNSASEIFTVRDVVFSQPEGSGPRSPLLVDRVGDTLVFTWPSSTGLLYNLRSVAENFSEDPFGWPVFGDNSSIVATPPENTLTVPLPPDPTRLFVIESFPAPPVSTYFDDFENGVGQWETGSDGGKGTVWELGVPTSGPFRSFSPTNCFATNLDGNYTANTNVWLRSPPIDLTGTESATLRFAHYYDIEAPEAVAPFTVYDFGQLAILDAVDDSELALLVPALADFIADWEEISFTLPADTLNKVIRIEFRLISDDIAFLPGWYVDDVQVTVP